MKTTLRLFAIAIAFALTSFVNAQTSTKGFNFQGYAIDPDGKSLASTAITVKFTLTSTSTSGSPFVEEHTLTSDAFGVFHAVVGEFDATSNTNFAKLDFTKKGDDYTLKVEVKKTSGGTYTTISNEPMKAVPYARKAENGVPVGTIVAFAGPTTNIPAGWLVCDGSLVSRTTYAQLFAAIGISWGYGDQSTTFAIPDARGMFLRGAAQAYTARDPDVAGRYAMGAGGNTGDNVGSGQWNVYGSHNHGMDAGGWHQHGYTSPLVSANTWDIQANSDNNGRTREYPTTDGGTTTGAGSHTHTIQNSGGSETRPNNVYVYYIVKY